MSELSGMWCPIWFRGSTTTRWPSVQRSRCCVRLWSACLRPFCRSDQPSPQSPRRGVPRVDDRRVLTGKSACKIGRRIRGQFWKSFDTLTEGTREQGGRDRGKLRIRSATGMHRAVLHSAREKSAAIVAGLCELWAAPRRALGNCCRVRSQGLARARTFLGASSMHGPLGSGSGGYIPSLPWGARAALGLFIKRTTRGDDCDRALPNVGARRPCRTVRLLYSGFVRNTIPTEVDSAEPQRGSRQARRGCRRSCQINSEHKCRHGSVPLVPKSNSNGSLHREAGHPIITIEILPIAPDTIFKTVSKLRCSVDKIAGRRPPSIVEIYMLRSRYLFAPVPPA